MNSRWMYIMAVMVGVSSVLMLTPAYAEAEPPQCSDGIDNDADGFTDLPDDPQCDDGSDNVEATAGDPDFASITIRYVRDRVFKGALADDSAECLHQRRVVLRRRAPDGWRVIARTFTTNEAKWRVYWPKAQGRYSAVALEATVMGADGNTIVCERDRSLTIRVRS